MRNKIPDGSEMIGYFFRKQKSLADQPSPPLAHLSLPTNLQFPLPRSVAQGSPFVICFSSSGEANGLLSKIPSHSYLRGIITIYISFRHYLCRTAPGVREKDCKLEDSSLQEGRLTRMSCPASSLCNSIAI